MTARGTVLEFDEHVGLGLVEAEDGTRLLFHCTAIADGTRTVGIGTAVRFDVAPGNRGVWEAAGLELA